VSQATKQASGLLTGLLWPGRPASEFVLPLLLFLRQPTEAKVKVSSAYCGWLSVIFRGVGSGCWCALLSDCQPDDAAAGSGNACEGPTVLLSINVGQWLAELHSFTIIW